MPAISSRLPTSPAPLKFAGKLDGGAFRTVTSPVRLTGLKQGLHTYQVRATDATGITDPTPATVSFIVDTIAPAVAVGAPSALFANAAATVTYKVTFTDATPLNFEGLNAGDVTLNKTLTANAAVSVSHEPGDPANVWTVTLGNISGNGKLGITVKAGSATDGVGLAAGASKASATFTADTVKPALTVKPNVTTTGGGPVTFIVRAVDANLATFNLLKSQVTFVGGALLADVSVARVGAAVWRVTVSNIRSGTGVGSFHITLPEGLAVDKAGNTSAGPVSSPEVAVNGARKMALSIVRPAVVKPGVGYTYGVIYTNTGNQQIDKIRLTVTLPEGATFNAAKSTPGWSRIGLTDTFELTGRPAVAAGKSGRANFAVTMPLIIPESRRETLTAAVYADIPESTLMATKTVTSVYDTRAKSRYA